ncbi:SGNH/GDSL hydrolase family protein [Formosa sp. 4Alg 33]|uniref:SGNH/GDSL hydrolase family protein n=1 Tax=Formosa sp. 4Alg 33 TaxID=3382189 RepID=UPI003D9C60BB
MKFKLLLIGCLAIFLASFKTTDTVPDVLIIGDSISLGYTPFVRKVLKEKANVVHNKGNAQHSGYGLEQIDEWIGDTKWDVIQFNWGLWDLCYRNPESKNQGNRDKVNGTVTFTPEEYERNLEALVVRLKETQAKLIFVTTSYVPKGELGRVEKSDKIYNKVAKRVMKKYGVTVNDINNISKKIHKDHGAGPKDVHYTKEGYELLSKPIIKGIEKYLND